MDLIFAGRGAGEIEGIGHDDPCPPALLCRGAASPWRVLDDDDVILDGYATSNRRLPRDRALWEARRGRRCAKWSIWNGNTFTGEVLGDHNAAAMRVMELLAFRHGG